MEKSLQDENEMARTTDTTSDLTVRLFGGLDIRIAGVALDAKLSQKAGWLLAILALAGGRETQRSVLAQQLWPFPDYGEDLAGYYLRRSLTELRKALGTQSWRLKSRSLRTIYLDLSEAYVDVLDFDAAIKAVGVEDMERAVSMYSGPLLTDCTQEWISLERERRRQSFDLALSTLARNAQTCGDIDAALSWLRQAVVAEPFSEAVHRDLMEALAEAGRPTEAIEVYHALRDRLREIHATAPAGETDELFRRVRNEARSGTAIRPSILDATRARIPSRVRTGNLPIPLSSLVGRRADTVTVQGFLSARRLVTLTGSGGVGKTRLAIAAATEEAFAYQYGAWFVDLAPVADAELLAATVAKAVKSPQQPGRSEVGSR